MKDRGIRLYSYVLRHDDGAAPNPFWGTCTLTICKPDIRRTANIGDWIVGTGSKNSHLKDGKIYDLSDSLVYAMKVTHKLSMADYDNFAQQRLPEKLPKWFNKDFRLRMGDCIYDFTSSTPPKIRKSVHTLDNMKRDLGGQFSLLSRHFYYFGEEPRLLPKELKHIIKRGRKHFVFDDTETLSAFEKWISQFKKNKLYADPQLRYEFEINLPEDQIAKCSVRDLKN